MVSMAAAPVAWDTERAEKLAREAYRYVGRTYPEGAPLEPLGIADRAVLEAQERGDWDAYVEALRQLMRVAEQEAIRRRRSSAA
jgi:hypothetical protein